MISVDKAYKIVMDSAETLGIESVSIIDSLGRVLAESVYADRDFPPFDRVTMDGITIAYESYENGQRIFSRESIGAAGSPKKILADRTKCIEIMTGAILPKGCDTVIRYEDLEETSGSFIINESISKGKNVHKKGSDYLKGELLLREGQVIKAIDVNILATVGISVVTVHQRPKVAVVSSGDELVDISTSPEEHQIRRSNSYMLASKLKQLGVSVDNFHITDNEDSIRIELSRLIEKYDTLLLSGGVSKGKFDFIPKVLDDIGVRKQIHRVAQRPGKPFWFGTKGTKTVFAFPGNPVSTLACFHRYFMPWLLKVQGVGYVATYVVLSTDIAFKPNLTYFCQGKLTHSTDGNYNVTPSHGNGSGDMVHPTKMDGFIVLPEGKEIFKAEEAYEFLSF